MEYDLTKLHPIHRKNFDWFMKSGMATKESLDQLYAQYVDLNQTVPDIIGKQESKMTAEQKERYQAKLEELSGNA